MATKAKAKRHKIERPRHPGAPYTIEQAADAMNVSPRTVRKRIVEGKLRAYRDGRAVRIAEADLAEYRSRLMYPQGAPDRAPGTGVTIRRHLRPRAGK